MSKIVFDIILNNISEVESDLKVLSQRTYEYNSKHALVALRRKIKQQIKRYKNLLEVLKEQEVVLGMNKKKEI